MGFFDAIFGAVKRAGAGTAFGDGIRAVMAHERW